MNKVNSDIEKKSYVGSKQACVCVLWDRERQRKREAEIEKEKETGTHTGRERTFVRLGWEGLCKEGTGTGELGHEQWKGNSYMKIQGKSVSSRTVNEEAMRQFSLMEAQKAACVAGAQWIWDPEKGDEVGEQARQLSISQVKWKCWIVFSGTRKPPEGPVQGNRDLVDTLNRSLWLP